MRARWKLENSCSNLKKKLPSAFLLSISQLSLKGISRVILEIIVSTSLFHNCIFSHILIKNCEILFLSQLLTLILFFYDYHKRKVLRVRHSDFHPSLCHFSLLFSLKDCNSLSINKL